MDLAMPLMDGCEATRQIMKADPSAKVLVLTFCQDENSIRRVLQAGALGYVPKQKAGSDLLTAISALNRGNSFLNFVVPGALLQGPDDSAFSI